MILTKKQLKKEGNLVLVWLKKLVSAKETKDLIKPIELGYESFGTESGSRLYLTRNGLMIESWDKEYGLCDTSTRTTHRKVSKRELKQIVRENNEEYGLEPKKLEKLYAQLIV